MRNLKGFQGVIVFVFVGFVLGGSVSASPSNDNALQAGDFEQLRNLDHTAYSVNPGAGNAQFGDTTGVSTTVKVPDGNTVLIGGQTMGTTASDDDGVPVLGKIPLLGRFFQSDREKRDDQTLLVHVTPTVIDPSEGD